MFLKYIYILYDFLKRILISNYLFLFQMIVQCQLRNARNKIVGSYRNLCVADYDCPPGWCCEGKLYARRCTQDCSRKTEPDVVPAGSYYGRQFWNLWAHKRHMDRNHY